MLYKADLIKGKYILMSVTEMLTKGVKGVLDARLLRYIMLFKLKTLSMQKLFENCKWTLHYF